MRSFARQFLLMLWYVCFTHIKPQQKQAEDVLQESHRPGLFKFEVDLARAFPYFSLSRRWRILVRCPVPIFFDSYADFLLHPRGRSITFRSFP